MSGNNRGDIPRRKSRGGSSQASSSRSSDNNPTTSRVISDVLKGYAASIDDDNSNYNKNNVSNKEKSNALQASVATPQNTKAPDNSDTFKEVMTGLGVRFRDLKLSMEGRDKTLDDKINNIDKRLAQVESSITAIISALQHNNNMLQTLIDINKDRRQTILEEEEEQEEEHDNSSHDEPKSQDKVENKEHPQEQKNQAQDLLNAFDDPVDPDKDSK